jgi:predicted ATPase
VSNIKQCGQSLKKGKMIKEITIKNFKSIQELKLELGRFNILIGENGCGKTNILEAIALGGAAAADKLDNEFLNSRGIRVTGPELMRAAFNSQTQDKEIYLKFVGDHDHSKEFYLMNDNKPYSAWKDVRGVKLKELFPELFKKIFKQVMISDGAINGKKTSQKTIEELNAQLTENIREKIEERVISIMADNYVFLNNPELSRFIIYSPENTTLRVFEKEGQILPLGIRGEGLFKLIKNLFLSEDKASLEEIKENLKLMDWFDDFQLPAASAPSEFVLKIKDRFLDAALDQFDQRSSNEGFLFWLFYLTLFISADTPDFFAIDNVEASFNPKLCVEVSKTLIRLAKAKNKQVIVATQNPSILDGINLHNCSERLFVIKRNTVGHTIARRITAKPDTKTPVKLSEAWTRGYIGGLPKNF